MIGISTLHNYCNKKGYILPKLFIIREDDENWFKKGVRFRSILEDYGHLYSSKFEEEIHCENAITGTGYSLGKKLGKKLAYEEICDKLGLEYSI